MSFLSEILRQTRRELEGRKGARRQADLKRRISELEPARRFVEAVRRPQGAPLRLIAEIKKASPSKGLIRAEFDPVTIARSYHAAGAHALSVLTERSFFQGDPSFLGEVRKAVPLSILQKDFVVDEFQIYEARVLGADAVLLIAAALEDEQLREYVHVANEAGVASLVEVHNEKELARVAETARLIGLNNRDLATFETDLATSERLMREMPPGRVVVSESGIASREDVQRLAALGVDALLIGETFMRAPVIEDKVRELMAITPEGASTR
ncbi:MAG: indole-3-glycerol phosphate synthase TrpC [Nitrospirae bacterium]|nr:indole-3-glycerol phosphate synthase TrpC [Nitrospirota bacterium]